MMPTICRRHCGGVMVQDNNIWLENFKLSLSIDSEEVTRRSRATVRTCKKVRYRNRKRERRPAVCCTYCISVPVLYDTWHMLQVLADTSHYIIQSRSIETRNRGAFVTKHGRARLLLLWYAHTVTSTCVRIRSYILCT